MLTTACGHRLIIKPPPEPQRTEQTEAWTKLVTETAADGDWLVVRGYNGFDNLVVATTNLPLSHAALFDKASGQVIEAVASGVRKRPLRDFVHSVHRLLIIRPKWWTDKRGVRAVRAAAKLVGKPYDFLGTVGGGSKDRYYCSELVVHVYKKHHSENERIPRVIEPGQMFLWGSILHDTGTRD